MLYVAFKSLALYFVPNAFRIAGHWAFPSGDAALLALTALVSLLISFLGRGNITAPVLDEASDATLGARFFFCGVNGGPIVPESWPVGKTECYFHW